MGERRSERNRSFSIFFLFFPPSRSEHALLSCASQIAKTGAPTRQHFPATVALRERTQCNEVRARSQRDGCQSEKRGGSGTGRRFRLLSFSATGDNRAPNPKYSGPRNTGARVERGGERAFGVFTCIVGRERSWWHRSRRAAEASTLTSEPTSRSKSQELRSSSSFSV